MLLQVPGYPAGYERKVAQFLHDQLNDNKNCLGGQTCHAPDQKVTSSTSRVVEIRWLLMQPICTGSTGRT